MHYSVKLQRECAKYLSSEGIYYRRNESGILVCINGQFVMFVFSEETPNRKIMASGGLENRPRSLSEFIQTVRNIQDEKAGDEENSHR